jgi:hypothetical protein
MMMRLRKRKGFESALCAFAVLGICSGALAASLDQRDDFQDGTTQGWRTGPANPNPPSWVADGGPDGDGDGFLRIEGNGGDEAGGNLVAFNTDQWTGDYLAAGVGAIRADLRNLGAGALVVRLLLEGPGGGVHTLGAAALQAGSGWRSFTFHLDAAALTGGSDPESTLSAVSKLRILHAPTPSGAEPVAGVLGVDNLTALSGDACLDAGLRGRARGLCRAYCNALDCDRRGPKRACRVLARLFRRRTGESPPCEIPDADRDGVEDPLDNCPSAPNTDQSDSDTDGLGDVCDNCPEDPNPGQEDGFGAVGIGDACDCPCFTTLDAFAIADDASCEPICVLARPTALDLTAIQCATDRPDYSAVVEEFTDFGGEPLCQLNLPPPDQSVTELGLGEGQVEACKAYVLEAAETAGIECR